jgi:YebC/PmpR family DNA-binding regulatory protein
MSGHSHWATIRRKKGAADAKRGQAFTRLAREIAIAARGGADPSNNFQLQLAVERARAQNMPKDSIERAIKRGSGEDKDAAVIEEITYEGYGPQGVALIIECLTDNRNRSVSELRHQLTRAGGSMAENGAVSWQFDREAYFYFPSSMLDFDKAFELAVENGADDVSEDDGMIEIVGPVDSFSSLNRSLREVNVVPEEAGLRMVPKQELELDLEKTIHVYRTIEGIEELDDVQNVYHNLKLSDEAMEKLEEE